MLCPVAWKVLGWLVGWLVGCFESGCSVSCLWIRPTCKNILFQHTTSKTVNATVLIPVSTLMIHRQIQPPVVPPRKQPGSRPMVDRIQQSYPSLQSKRMMHSITGVPRHHLVRSSLPLSRRRSFMQSMGHRFLSDFPSLLQQQQRQRGNVVAGLSSRFGGQQRHLSAPPPSSLRKLKGIRGKQGNVMLRVGAPFVLFSILAAWVVSNALDGKLKEMEASQGKTSKSIRQAALEQEHDEMLERLNKIVVEDFDNTKRIKRPHEVLEERRKERERRNAWHRRAYRAIFGGNKEEGTK